MLKPALPVNESDRLKSLRDYEILDTLPEPEFDDLTLLASRICAAPVAMISLVDENRQWFKSKCGTATNETPRDIAFCAHGILEKEVFVVEDATMDERFSDNPLVNGKSQVRFYAGAPLVNHDGYALGMICVNDRVPRKLTNEQMHSLRALSRQVVAQLELRRNNKRLEQAVQDNHRVNTELKTERNLLCALLENTHDHIYFKDTESRFIRCSNSLASLYGVPDVAQLIGRRDRDFFAQEHEVGFFAEEQKIVQTGKPILDKVERIMWKGGRIMWVLTSKMPLRSKEGKIIGTFGISKDITSIKETEEELVRVHRQLIAEIAERKLSEGERQLMEVQLRQAQKLEAIGQLAAGIAHEINTPIQYVGDNTRFFRESFEVLAKLLRSHEELLQAAQRNQLTSDLLACANEAFLAADVAYLLDQVPVAINETIEGIERITHIVRAMKEFSHPGGAGKAPADLNKAIESTVTVARNEWKQVAEVKLNLEPDLPQVACFLSEFNQSVLNLLVNATHAIAEAIKNQTAGKGLITISTRRAGDYVEISVRDTGTGIPEPARPHIFEPFFTTKPVGKGTGQGLSLVYCNIVKRHGGTVSFETEIGKGTCFLLQLPVSAAATE